MDVAGGHHVPGVDVGHRELKLFARRTPRHLERGAQHVGVVTAGERVAVARAVTGHAAVGLAGVGPGRERAHRRLHRVSGHAHRHAVAPEHRERELVAVGAERRRAEGRIDRGRVGRGRRAPRCHQRAVAHVAGRAVHALIDQRTAAGRELRLLRLDRRVAVHAPRLGRLAVLALEQAVGPGQRVATAGPLVGDRLVAFAAAPGIEQRRIVGADRDRGHAARGAHLPRRRHRRHRLHLALATGAARDQRAHRDERDRSRGPDAHGLIITASSS